jgi:cell division protein FtsI (penicillin-binding protein 3)
MVGQLGAERTFNKKLYEGENINLGIDIRLQYIVRDELEKARIKYNSKSATAIIADLNSGEILSLVSLPDFNPNQSINPEINSYTNTATLNLYEMGSTFKMFTITAALDLSQVNLETKFDASKSIKIANYEIKDYKPQNRILSTKEIFLNSSNIGSSLIALELGKLKLKNFYEKIGLLNISNINLTEKTKPIIPKKWGKIQTATLSFGHGLSISPIQMIEASSKLFNNNLDYKTQINKKNKESTIEKTKFLSENTINALKYLMYENTLNGTARKAQINGFKIGGKTATGEKAEEGKYDKTKLISSFLSVFPIEKPKFISLVLFDEPSLGNLKNYREGATGGKTAAPVTANIYRRIFPILGITKNYNLDRELLVDNKGEFNFVSY